MKNIKRSHHANRPSRLNTEVGFRRFQQIYLYTIHKRKERWHHCRARAQSDDFKVDIMCTDVTSFQMILFGYLFLPLELTVQVFFQRNDIIVKFIVLCIHINQIKAVVISLAVSSILKWIFNTINISHTLTVMPHTDV